MTLQALDGYWSEFSSNWRKAKRGKASGVHDLRVTCRRFVAALELLEAASKDPSVPRLRRRFKKLIRRLGRLRDIQVQVSLVEKLQPSAALRKFHRQLEQRERDEAEEVRRVLDRSSHKKLLKQWHNLKTALESGKLGRSDAQARKAVRKVLRERADRVRTGFEALDLRDMDTIHAFRIALKKLRYALENAESLFGIRARSKTSKLQEYQRQLGEIRDLELVRRELLHSSDAKQLRPIAIKLRNRIRSRLKVLAKKVALGKATRI